MVNIPLQAPGVLLYEATSFLAQNKGKTASRFTLQQTSNAHMLPALCGGTAGPNEPA